MARKSRWALEFANYKEVRGRFTGFAAVLQGDNPALFQQVSRVIVEAYKKAADLVRDKARSNAISGGVPSRLFSGANPAIFSYADVVSATTGKRKQSALVGVRTGAPPRRDMAIYREWGKKSGHLKGISIARIFETGTRRGIKGRRFFRSAIFATRGRVLTMLADAYEFAMSKFAK